MILYFDTYLSEAPLHSIREEFKPILNQLNNIRSNGSNYKFHSKVVIFKFTLSSYFEYDWDEVIINVESENIENLSEINSFLKDACPTSKLSFKRSTSKDDWIENLKLLRGNEWIFFSPNNDHPIVHNNKINFDNYLTAASLLEDKYPNAIVSILYSHFPEFWNSLFPCKNLYFFLNHKLRVIENNKSYFVVKLDKTPLDSIYIHRRDNLIKFFESAPQNKKIVRLEDIDDTITYCKENIIIVPKIEICRHYDSYVHTLNLDQSRYVSEQVVPVLFIPPGFFEKNIKLKYGYNDYSTDFLNCNPLAFDYSFNNLVNGTDYKRYYNELPYFIKTRIKEIKTSEQLSYFGKSKECELIENPWNTGVIYKDISRSIFNIYRYYLKNFNFYKYSSYHYLIRRYKKLKITK